jgi:hypothetical protein
LWAFCIITELRDLYCFSPFPRAAASPIAHMQRTQYTYSYKILWKLCAGNSVGGTLILRTERERDGVISPLQHGYFKEYFSTNLLKRGGSCVGLPDHLTSSHVSL